MAAKKAAKARARKAAAKKSGRKPAAKKAAGKKSGRKPAAKKAAGKKPTGKKTARKPTRAAGGSASARSGSAEVTRWIADVDDWRGAWIAKLRAVIQDAVPDVVEEIKWRKPSNPAGVPVWSFEGLLCTGEVYKDKVKFTFAQGAALRDPTRMFNASLDAGTRRAVDIREGDAFDTGAFRQVVQDAATHNARARAGK